MIPTSMTNLLKKGTASFPFKKEKIKILKGKQCD
jgi:hypothetical protein